MQDIPVWAPKSSSDFARLRALALHRRAKSETLALGKGWLYIAILLSYNGGRHDTDALLFDRQGETG